MSALPSDPLEAFNWAVGHTGDAWWVIVAVAAGIAWTSKRLRAWNGNNSPAGAARAAKAKAAAEAAMAQWMSRQAPPPSAPAPAAAPKPAAAAYTAAPSYTAAAYAAQAAYAAPVAAAPSQGGSGRKLHREGGGAQRTATPAARSVDVPAADGGAWTLRGAFGDPAHARTAIVIAEVLGPPPGLR